MKKFLTLTALTALVLGACVTAEAAFVQNVDYDNNIISVSGQMSGTGINSMVFIAVKNPRDTEVKLDGSQYLTAVNTDGNGNFETSFQIEPSDDSGDYMYTLTVTSYSGTPYEEEFYFCSADELLPVLKEVADAADADGVSSVIEANNEILSFMYDTYSTLSQSAKEEICEGLAGYSQFETVESFNEAYYDLYIPQAVNNAKGAQEVYEILTDYEKYSGISELPIYPEFEKLENTKMNVYAYMAGKGDKNCDEMGVTFTEGAVLQLLAATQNSSQVKTLLEEYADVIGLDLSDVNDLKEPGKVYSELVRQSFGSISALQDKIDDLVDDNVTLPPSTGGSGGGGTSGGSGGGMNASLSNDREEITLPEKEPEQPEKYFNDLDGAAWAEDAINSLYKKDIVSGYGDSTFKPSNSMTREEFAALAVKAFGLLDEEAKCDFEDVSEDDWYYIYVASLYDKGLISGIGDGLFGSGSPIKRQDAAVMLFNISRYSDLELGNTRDYADFSDEADISEYAVQSIRALYEAEVINGSDDGCFHPHNNITRAECCVMVNKMPGIN